MMAAATTRQGATPVANEPVTGTTASGIYYELHGQGEPLFLGFPVMASHAEVFGSAAAAVRAGFVDALADRYRVLLADYPSIGRSAAFAPEAMTIDRVCADMLSLADAAGFDRFSWWGATFGAVIGLQLAARSSRLNALVCAGWPPLGAPYADMLRGSRANLANPPEHARVILRSPSQYSQWVAFYESMSDVSEAETLARIRCPRLVVYGENAVSSVADLPLPFADIIRAHRAELEAQGWQVTEIPGADGSVVLDPKTLAPVARAWLDKNLNRGSAR